MGLSGFGDGTVQVTQYRVLVPVMKAYPVLVIALGAGAAAMFVVAWLMRLLYNLHAEGNVRIEQAVGMPGKVYLTIPAPPTGGAAE